MDFKVNMSPSWENFSFTDGQVYVSIFVEGMWTPASKFRNSTQSTMAELLCGLVEVHQGKVCVGISFQGFIFLAHDSVL